MNHIIENMNWYLKHNRFQTVKIENKQKLGLARKGFENSHCIVGKSKSKDWFYVIDDGKMTYFYCNK